MEWRCQERKAFTPTANIQANGYPKRWPLECWNPTHSTTPHALIRNIGEIKSLGVPFQTSTENHCFFFNSTVSLHWSSNCLNVSYDFNCLNVSYDLETVLSPILNPKVIGTEFHYWKRRTVEAIEPGLWSQAEVTIYCEDQKGKTLKISNSQ